MVAPSLIMTPGTGEGSDPAISVLLSVAAGSAAPLCGPSSASPPSWQVLKISFQKVARSLGTHLRWRGTVTFCSFRMDKGGGPG